MDAMRGPRPWRVFVSRTSELARLPTGRSFGAAARDAITTAGHALVDMSDFPASTDPPVEVCAERVRSADVYVGLIGFRWGSPVPGDPAADGAPRSYTEFEFDTATAIDKPRLVFLLADSTEGSDELLIDPEFGDRQASFRDRLSHSGITRKVVHTPAALETAVLHALHELSRRASSLDATISGPSTYRQQVVRIAPPDLLDRAAELKELAAFCLAPDETPAETTRRTDAEATDQYLWWRAPAWAGKSALLSSFVLRPPETLRERVRIVSFFITARYAGHDTRDAFIAALNRQLGDLTGRQVPSTPDEGTRDTDLLDLLEHAALHCRAAGRRLVLVVDGLDEDRGVTHGPDAHSIAALLPARPPAGMRVIVAGRPNPPIPEDVPGIGTPARRRAVTGVRFGVHGQTEAAGASAAVVRRSRRNVSGAFHTENMVISAPNIT